MSSKSQVNDILMKSLDQRGVELWWDMCIRGLGYVSPNEVWETDPERVLEYAQSYIVEA